MSALAAKARPPDGVEAIKPYKIHASTYVSSKYLDLTTKKLELTRLPHEILVPPHRGVESGTSKAEIEPLVDYWLEEYDWRSREAAINAHLPQFRILLPDAAPESSSRLHYVHKQSPRPMAIPLLFCHGLPGGIVEASKIIDLLTEPSEEGMQAFHVVVPSVPGCGFSDHFKLEDPGMGEVARVFDTLMSTLGYEHYVAHGSDWGFGVCRMLATHHSSTCLAVHTTTPIPYLERPSFTWRLWNYLGFLIARFTRANVPGLRFGYHHSDFLPRTPRRPNLQSPGGSISGRGFSPGPQALAYGMCDSPVGLLAWIRHAQYERTKMVEAFSSAETIDFTMMSWLPGPEAPLRFMYGAPTTSELRDVSRTWSSTRLAISTFSSPHEAWWPVQWAACVQPLTWTRHHEGEAGWPVWQRPADVAKDMSIFFGETILPREPRLKAGWIAPLESVD